MDPMVHSIIAIGAIIIYAAVGIMSSRWIARMRLQRALLCLTMKAIRRKTLMYANLSPVPVRRLSPGGLTRRGEVLRQQVPNRAPNRRARR